MLKCWWDDSSRGDGERKVTHSIGSLRRKSEEDGALRGGTPALLEEERWREQNAGLSELQETGATLVSPYSPFLWFLNILQRIC